MCSDRSAVLDFRMGSLYKWSVALDFRILKEKSARGCGAAPSERIQTDTTGRTKRAGSRKRLFGFRNREFNASPLKQEVIYHRACGELRHALVGEARFVEWRLSCRVS